MSSGLEDSGVAPFSAASRSAFCADTNTCCSTNCARSFACATTCRVSLTTYKPETSATTIRTKSAVASVNLFFRLSGILARGLVLFQLVVKCFQADAQKLRGARLVLIGRAQGLDDQLAFSRFHRGAGRKTQAGEFARLRHWPAREIIRQVLAANGAVVACDGRAFQNVAQLAHVPWPRIRLE